MGEEWGLGKSVVLFPFFLGGFQKHDVFMFILFLFCSLYVVLFKWSLINMFLVVSWMFLRYPSLDPAIFLGGCEG